METVSLTYDELADRLRISGASARNLVRRKRWARTTGNDGKARISVPVDALDVPAETPIESPTSGATDGAIAVQFARLEVEVQGLKDLVASERSRATAAEARAAAAEADRDAWRTMATKPWWKRVAGG